MAKDLDEDALNEVIRRAEPVAECLRALGHRSFVVGGLVRDLHTGGGSSGDVDMTTDARPEVMKEAFASIADDLWSQGERFGTIGLRIGDTEFEVTTHRSEQYEPGSRKPRVEFSSAIEADLSRRDFTVNAMAVELPTGRLVDPFGGAVDLENGVLRTPGSPAQSFIDDPLRMLRAARFFSGYGLEPAVELEVAMAQHADRIDIVSRERIRDETAKLLDVARPGDGIELLGRTGLLARVEPGYDQATSREVARVVDAVSAEALVRRAAFYLVAMERGGHDALGEHMRLRRYSSRERRETIQVLLAVVNGVADERFGDNDVGARRFVSTSGDHLAATLQLIGVERLAGASRAAELAVRIDRLRSRESLESLGSALTGAEVMAELNISTGPAIGEAVGFLTDLRIEAGELDREETVRRLHHWWAKRRGDVPGQGGR